MRPRTGPSGPPKAYTSGLDTGCLVLGWGHLLILLECAIEEDGVGIVCLFHDLLHLHVSVLQELTGLLEPCGLDEGGEGFLGVLLEDPNHTPLTIVTLDGQVSQGSRNKRRQFFRAFIRSVNASAKRGRMVGWGRGANVTF